MEIFSTSEIQALAAAAAVDAYQIEECQSHARAITESKKELDFSRILNSRERERERLRMSKIICSEFHSKTILCFKRCSNRGNCFCFAVPVVE